MASSSQDNLVKKGTQESSSSASVTELSVDTSSSEHTPPRRKRSFVFEDMIVHEMKRNPINDSTSTPPMNSSSSSGGLFLPKKESSFECLQHSGDSLSGGDDMVKIDSSLVPNSPTDTNLTSASEKPSTGKKFVGPPCLPKWTPLIQHSPFSSSEEASSSAVMMNLSERSSYPELRQSESHTSDVIIPDSQCSQTASPVTTGFATSTQNTVATTAPLKQPSILYQSSEVFPPIKPLMMPLHVTDSSPIQKVDTTQDSENDVVVIGETPPRQSSESYEEIESQLSQGGSSQDLFNFTTVADKASMSPKHTTISIKRKAPTIELERERKRKRSHSPIAEGSSTSTKRSIGRPISEAKITDEGTMEITLSGEVEGLPNVLTLDCEKLLALIPKLLATQSEHINTVHNRTVDNPPLLPGCIDHPTERDPFSMEGNVTDSGENNDVESLQAGTKIYARKRDKYFYPGIIVKQLDPKYSGSSLPMFLVKCDRDIVEREMFSTHIVKRLPLSRGHRLMYFVEEFEAFFVGIVNVRSKSDPETYEVQAEDNSVISVPITNFILSEQQMKAVQDQSGSMDSINSIAEMHLDDYSVCTKSRKCSCKGCLAKLKLPIPDLHVELAENRELFKGLSFIISRDKNFKYDHIDYIDKGVKPFKKEELKKVINHGGGRVIETFDDQAIANGSMYYISNGYRNTPKHFMSLACCIPCLAQDWVFNCSASNKLLDTENYRLARGRNALTFEIVEKAKSDTPLLNKKIYIHEDKHRMDLWISIIPLFGGTLLPHLPKVTNNDSLDDCDGIVILGKIVTPTLLKKASSLKIPIATGNWLAQVIVTGEWYDINSDPKFTYNLQKNIRKSSRTSSTTKKHKI